MLPVRIFSNDRLIGHADLFASDPGMGVASGEFRPTEAYFEIRSAVDAICNGLSSGYESLGLRAETEQGVRLEAAGGIVIVDAMEFDIGPRQVDVCGISNANYRYGEWFGDGPFYKSYFSGEP